MTASADRDKRHPAFCVNTAICSLRPPVYHGHPVSEEGFLVFFDYGWSFLDVMREYRFSTEKEMTKSGLRLVSH